MTPRAVAIVLVLATLSSPGLHAQGRSRLSSGRPEGVRVNATRLTRAVAMLDDAAGAGTISGGAVLIARHGVIVVDHAFGLADRERPRVFTPSTIAYIASLSKPLTSAAALTLVDEGRIELDDPVELYLPYLTRQQVKLGDGSRAHRAFTLRHLLTHTSGLRLDSPLRARPTPEWRRSTLAATVEAVAETDLEFEPGSRVQYSNIGIAMVGRLIEVVSGQSFESFMRARLFGPLGMRDTSYNVTVAAAPRLAPQYVYEQRDGRLVQTGRDDVAGVEIVNTMPNGGAYSTTHDVAAFLQMLLNGGQYEGTQILAPRTVRMMLTDQTPSLQERLGLGWFIGAGNRQRPAAPMSESAVTHPGGGRNFAWLDPEAGIVGVVLLQPAADFGPLGARPELWSTVGPLEGVWRRLRHLVYAALED